MFNKKNKVVVTTKEMREIEYAAWEWKQIGDRNNGVIYKR